jgi:hypothetical protein
VTVIKLIVAALVLMACGQVLARLGVLQIRRVRAIRYPAAAARTPDPAGFGAEICREAVTCP